MATNPNNAFGTNAGYSGRTSVNAFNDDLAIYDSRGIVSGWACSPDSGMTISLGGNGTTRDVAVAEDNIGNRTTVNNTSGSPISLTIAPAPVSNSRIDAIVAYVVNPPVSQSTVQDAYDTVGILDVQGTVASTPVAPNDSAIRTAITADGASGTTAYYVVLGYITIVNGTTDITGNMISQGEQAALRSKFTEIADGSIGTNKLSDAAITAAKIASGAVSADKIDWTTVEDITTTGTLDQDITHAIYIRFASGLQVAMGLYDDDTALQKNNYMDRTVNFTKTFISLPYSIVGLKSDSVSPDIGVLTVSRVSISATSLTMRAFYNNAGTSARKPGFEWLAIGFWK